MKKRLQKMLSVILVVSLLSSMLSTVAFATSANPNPRFTVEYYAYFDDFDFSSTGTMPVIDTNNGGEGQGGKMPTNDGTVNGKFFELTNGKTGVPNKDKDDRESELVKLFDDKSFNFLEAPNLGYFDIVSPAPHGEGSANANIGNSSYELLEVRVKNGSTWNSYSPSKVVFTNDTSAPAANNLVVITDNTVLRLIYQPKQTTTPHTSAANFFDYDITDGKVYDGNGNETSRNPNALQYAKTSQQGINSPSNYVGSGQKFAFGNENTGTGLATQVYPGTQYLINGGNSGDKRPANAQTYKGCSFELVTGLNANGLPKFANGIVAPDLFSLNTQNVKGKTVYSGAGNTLTFIRDGDTYTLSDVTINGRLVKDDAETFATAEGKIGSWSWSIPTNFFWPMDGVPSYGTDGHDLKFGKHDLRIYRKYGTGTNDTFPTSDEMTKDHNSYFGMSYDIAFELDKDYVGPLEYFFYGDDDMWVFLVPKDSSGNWDYSNADLVCDIGGVHSSVGAYVNLWDYIPKSRSANREYELRIFYTERGASGSSCYMQFTLPTVSEIPQSEYGSLRVTKDVNGTSTDEFTFDLKLEGVPHVKVGEKDIYSVYPYTIFAEDGTKKSEGYIQGGQQTINLADGDYVEIPYLPKDATYTVTESDGKYSTTIDAPSDNTTDDETRTTSGTISVTTDAQGNEVVDNDVVTFTNSPLIDILVTKTWVDFDNTYETRPDTIDLDLYKKVNGADVKVDKEPVRADSDSDPNTWEYKFTDLPKYDENGALIEYTITEADVPGYTKEVDGYTVTNTLETTSVSGTKTWDDNDDEYGNRPASITINLTGKPKDSQQVVVSQSKTVTESDGWAYSFTNLPVWYGNKEIDYEISEADVPYYDSEVEGYNVTNTPETTEVTVTKFWEDNDDQDGIRPENITLHLYKNVDDTTQVRVYKEPTRVKLNNKWEYTFSDQPKYENGKEIDYTVKEMSVEGYTPSEITGDADKGFKVTNTHIPATIDIPVTKEWRDNNDQDGVRPDSIWIYVCANDTVVDEVYLTGADTTNFWHHTFTGLPKYQNGGNEIQYSVHEQVPDGYWVKADQNDPYKLINIYEPKKTSLVVSKVWDDNSNQDGIRPTKVTIELVYKTEKDTTLRGPVEVATLSASNNWQYTFENLDKFTDHGYEVQYDTREIPVPGYDKPSYSDVTDGSIIVTNKHKPETTSVSGKKTWIDNNDQDGIRPDSITINLLANGEKIDSRIVTAADGWSWNFGNLPVKNAGKTISYTITEDVVEGYETTIKDYDVTNKHTPGTISVSGTKTWIDNDNQDGKRPTSITINLLADGKKVDSKTVTADANGEWKFSFANLDAKKGGKDIVYTITEEPVEGYTTTIDGYNVTNTHTSETTSVEGTKTWVDHNDSAGLRPDSITINLLADGVKVNSKTVNADGGWSWEFADLAVYKNCGDVIIYTITEEPVEGYTTTINGYNVTNTYDPPSVPSDPSDPETPVIVVPPKPPVEDLGDDDTPKGSVDPSEELPEDEIPLGDAEVPKTGDLSLLWAAAAAVSGLGLAGLKLSDKKRKDDEEN